MAGSSTIGALKVVLGLDSAEFTGGLSKAQAQLRRAGGQIQKLGGQMESIGARLSLGLTAPIAALGVASIQAATESRQAFGQVQAALASMGAASGKSAGELQKAAASLQSLSTFDDDDILRKVTANLLTFGNVSGEAFDRAQLAAVNLSARLGQDLQSSAIQVGKALNDPIKGVTALQRVGVSFTAQQKDQIKAMAEAGDVAGAQTIILAELEKQFGGAAAALREATPNAALQEEWRNFSEAVGEVALKVLPPLTAFLTQALEAFNGLSPGMQTAAVAGLAVAAAIGPLVGIVGAITTIVGAALPVIGAVGPMLAGIGAVITGAVMPALTGFASFLTATLIPAAIATAPVWVPVAAAIAAVGAAIWAVIKFWPQIKAFAQNVIDVHVLMAKLVAKAARDLFEGVKTWLQDKLGAVLKWVETKAKAVGDAFFELYDRVVGNSYVPDLVKGIGEWFSKLDGVMVKPAEAANDNVAASFADLADRVNASVDAIYRGIKNKDWSTLVRGLQNVVGDIKKAAAEASKITGGMGSRANGIAGGVGAAAGAAAPYVGGVGGSVLSGVALGAQLGSIVPGIGTAIGAVVGGIGGLISGIFGSSKKKKAAAAEAARRAAEEAERRAQEEAARLLAIANQKRELEIQLMEAQGNAEGALAARRADALAATDDTNDALLQMIFDAQDAAEAAATASAAASEAAAKAAEDYEAAQRKATDATEAARDALADAYDREADALRGTIDRFQALADSLRGFRRGLEAGGASSSYSAVGAEFRRVAAMARLGNEAALGDLQGVSEKFLEVSKDSARSAQDYAADVRAVKAAVTAAEQTATRQVSVAQQQLAALSQSLTGLIQIDTSVLSVRDAVAGLGVALTAQIGTMQQMVADSQAASADTATEIAALRDQLNIIAMNTRTTSENTEQMIVAGIPVAA